jgi:hypothetical protein
MKKPPTGEPYAGKPPVRFGGRGRREPIPTPIALWMRVNALMAQSGLRLLRKLDCVPGMTSTARITPTHKISLLSSPKWEGRGLPAAF